MINRLRQELFNNNYILCKQGNLYTIKKRSQFQDFVKEDIYKKSSSQILQEIENKNLISSFEDESLSRKYINQFSKKSAYRLKQLMLKTRLNECALNSLSLTLTFPTMIYDLSIATNLLKRFNEWLKRNYDFGIIWKKEFTKKGNVHFHLVLLSDEYYHLGNYFYTKDLEDFKEIYRGHGDVDKKNFKGFQLRYIIQKKWLQMLNLHLTKKNNIDFNHINAFNSAIDLEHVKSVGIICYLADYLTTDETTFHKNKSYQNNCPKFVVNSGRWWGKVNLDKYMSEQEFYYLNGNHYYELQKYLNKKFLDKDDLSIRKIQITDDYSIEVGLTTFNTVFNNDKIDLQPFLYSDNLDINNTFKDEINKKNSLTNYLDNFIQKYNEVVHKFNKNNNNVFYQKTISLQDFYKYSDEKFVSDTTIELASIRQQYNTNLDFINSFKYENKNIYF